MPLLPSPSTATATPPHLRYLDDADDVGRLLLRHDWDDYALGPIAHWPPRLHEVLKLCLNSNFPYIVYWGPQLLTFWNSAGSLFFGGQHPHALGLPLHEIQSDAARALAPRIAQVLKNGLAVLFEDMQVIYRRNDYEEEFYETFSYSPILNDEGLVTGIITPIIDTTAHVIGVRRLRTLGDLATQTRSAHSLAQYCESLSPCLARNPYDLPFFALYAGQSGGAVELVAQAGLPADPAAGLPLQIATGETPAESDSALRYPAARLAAAMAGGQLTVLAAASVIQPVPQGGWDAAPRSVAVLPIRAPAGAEQQFFLVAGINPYKLLDRDYRDFLGMLATQIGRGLADCRAFEEAAARARAELASLMRRTTMGELATSIAHEVNQPLAALVIDANACLRWLAATPPNLAEAQAAARRIVSSGRHAGNVVRGIREFLNGAASTRRHSNLVECVWASLGLVRTEALRHAIGLRVRLAPTLPQVCADTTQIQQVMLNLLLNAIEALQQVHDRTRRITLEMCAGADGVQILVHDNGSGFGATDPERLFDAFYTTKPEGLGFGLSLSRSIIEAHGGRMYAAARKPHGVTIGCMLPAAGEGPR